MSETLLSTDQITKTVGAQTLFEDLTLGVKEKERIGLIGPNGAGKSTLLRALAGQEVLEAGRIVTRRSLQLAYVAQEDQFPTDRSILSVATQLLQPASQHLSVETEVQATVYLGLAGFSDFEQDVMTLSGGWRKRLSLAVAFAKEPDLLLLDEPTNHMDWDGILWLESYLAKFKKSFVLVSHDRAFLNRLCNRTIEISRMYQKGYLSFDCGYERFLQKKEEYISEQEQRQSVMGNKARRELSWLRAGVKARTTKSQSRIKEAHQLLDDLGQVKERNRAGKAAVKIQIDATGRLSKKLIECKGVSLSFPGKEIIKDLSIKWGPKTCVGLLGENGAGKTTLLRAICGLFEDYKGEVLRAEGLRVVYFDQKREDLPKDFTLLQYLGDESDYVTFKSQSIHVASYASRFLFSQDKMQLKISQLSGGEQARLLIAKLLLQPADALVLDEPTNDLDISSIEVLEQSLEEFPGLVLVVSHDRAFLSQLCKQYLAIEGNGRWSVYADLSQWLSNRRVDRGLSIKKGETKKAKSPKVKLSYNEKKQLETIETDIEVAEVSVSEAQEELEKEENYTDSNKMQKWAEELEQRQARVDELYAIWNAIEEKKAQQHE